MTVGRAAPVLAACCPGPAPGARPGVRTPGLQPQADESPALVDLSA